MSLIETVIKLLRHFFNDSCKPGIFPVSVYLSTCKCFDQLLQKSDF